MWHRNSESQRKSEKAFQEISKVSRNRKLLLASNKRVLNHPIEQGMLENFLTDGEETQSNRDMIL